MNTYTLEQFKELPKSDLNNFAQICIDKLLTEYGKDAEIDKIRLQDPCYVIVDIIHNDEMNSVSTSGFDIIHIGIEPIKKKIWCTYFFELKNHSNE